MSSRPPALFNCVEFGGWGRGHAGHSGYSRATALAGCPRCMFVLCQRVSAGTAESLCPEELNMMEYAVNHTLDGYWKGMRAPLIRALEEMSDGR